MVGQRQNCPDSEGLMPGGTRQIQACLNTWYKLLSGVLVSDLSEPTHCWKGGAPRGAKSAKKETEDASMHLCSTRQ